MGFGLARGLSLLPFEVSLVVPFSVTMMSDRVDTPLLAACEELSVDSDWY